VNKQGAWSLQRDRTDFIHLQSKTAEWLAGNIFNAFPNETAGLMFYILDCGYIYHRGQAPDGALLDVQMGIYRDPAQGDCDECMPRPKGWEPRVLEQRVIYKIKLELPC
jgi:hypothetical protein